jgi:hypothetical protein
MGVHIREAVEGIKFHAVFGIECSVHYQLRLTVTHRAHVAYQPMALVTRILLGTIHLF